MLASRPIFWIRIRNRQTNKTKQTNKKDLSVLSLASIGVTKSPGKALFLQRTVWESQLVDPGELGAFIANRDVNLAGADRGHSSSNFGIA